MRGEFLSRDISSVSNPRATARLRSRRRKLPTGGRRLISYPGGQPIRPPLEDCPGAMEQACTPGCPSVNPGCALTIGGEAIPAALPVDRPRKPLRGKGRFSPSASHTIVRARPKRKREPSWLPLVVLRCVTAPRLLPSVSACAALRPPSRLLLVPLVLLALRHGPLAAAGLLGQDSLESTSSGSRTIRTCSRRWASPDDQP